MIVLLMAILTIGYNSNAQISIGISIGGIGYHPKDDINSQFYKWKIDQKGKFVGYAGFAVFASFRLNDYIGIKFQQSIVAYDCAGKPAGITHIGLDLYDDIIGIRSSVNEFSMSVGPWWYYRKNWNQIDTYVNDPAFMRLNQENHWETKFVWYGGQIEYARKISEQNSFAINILPGFPYIYTAGFGIKNKTWR